MRMKKTTKIISCVLAVALLAGCGQSGSGQSGRGQSGTVSATSEQKESQADTTADGSSETAAGQQSGDGETEGSEREGSAASSSNILIAYFAEAENSEVDAVASPSVTVVNGETKGRMRALADMIQAETGGDLFSIQTSVDYPGEIGALIDYAADEQDDEARPELTSHIENLDDYDVIFVGYPNWWYDMPMVLYSFFEEYDFSGKNIIPINSHNGSRF